jgi:hypothetical protein
MAQSFEANYSINTNSINESNDTWQNLHLEFGNQEWSILNVDLDKPGIEVFRSQDLSNDLISLASQCGIQSSYLQMVVHDSAPAEIALEEMDNNEFCTSGDIHNFLFILDFRVSPSSSILHLLCTRYFRMELLQPLLAEHRERVIFVIFQSRYECVFIVRTINFWGPV